MKPSEIKVGRTYYGCHDVTRDVTGIKNNVVFYRGRDMRRFPAVQSASMNLDTFAAWAEGEVK
jgi:hypothetical protein